MTSKNNNNVKYGAGTLFIASIGGLALSKKSFFSQNGSSDEVSKTENTHEAYNSPG
jgi:hypothetical protein